MKRFILLISLVAYSLCVLQGIYAEDYTGEIDWKEVASSKQFALLHAGSGNEQAEKNFTKNYDEAKANGLKVGVYHYSWTELGSYTEGVLDAKFCLALIRGKQYEFPIFYGMYETKPGRMLDESLKGFCDLLEVNGYYCALAIDSVTYTYHFKPETLEEYDVWMFDVNPFTGNITIKETGTEYNPKTDRYIHLQESYVDYEQIMKEGHFNGY